MLPLLSMVTEAGTLGEAWSAAEQGGVELRLVAEEKIQADTIKTQAWALVSPKLVLGGSYTINEYPIIIDFSESFPESLAPLLEDVEPIVVNKQQYLAWNASVIQPLFSGQALPLLNAATQTVRAARQQELARRAEIRAGIATAYYGVVLARQGLSLADRGIEHARAYARLAAQQVDVGLAPPTARLQAEIAVARAERQRAAAGQGKVAAEQALARLTGWPPEAPVELPPPPVMPFDSVEQAVSRAVERRPDVAVAQHQERAARFARTAADLDWLPTIDGRFTWSHNENSGFSADKDMWQVVVKADWVLWDGGARIASEQKMASQRRMASLAAERARDSAVEEVRGSYEAWSSADTALRSVERELELAKENLRLAEVGFSAGTLSFLEVEDARVGLLAAELGVLQTRCDRDLAALRVLKATGDL